MSVDAPAEVTVGRHLRRDEAAAQPQQVSGLPAPSDLPPLPQVHQPRFLRSIELAALPTALSCTRLFVASTLWRWGACFVEADASLLAVQLVRYSLQACGEMDPDVRIFKLEQLNVIHLRLLGFERSIGIEVWDNMQEPAVLPEVGQGEELHGLGLVDARAKGWGSALTAQGRVLWAEVGV